MVAGKIEVEWGLRAAVATIPTAISDNGTATDYESLRVPVHGYSDDRFLCELPDGTVQMISYQNIRFLDSQDKFLEYSWVD